MRRYKELEVILIGQVSDDLKPIFHWERSFKLRIEDFSATQIEIPIRKKTRLIMETRNPSGDLVPLNQCLLKGNHLIASSITLRNDQSYPFEDTQEKIKSIQKEIEEEEDPKKIKELMLQSELLISQSYGIRKNKLVPMRSKTRYIYADINLLDVETLGEKIDIVKVLWNRFEKKLTNKTQDYNELEQEYSARLESQQEMFYRIISTQQDTIEELQQKLVLQPIAYGRRVTQIISESVIEKMEGDYMSSPQLREEITQLKSYLKQRKNGVKSKNSK